jgi:hypothetical protein
MLGCNIDEAIAFETVPLDDDGISFSMVFIAFVAGTAF